MELRHLAAFVAVAEERNFTRAAARLHVVQSAVSAAVKTLEHDLGAPLLDRNSRRVRLTDAGQVLLPRARTTLDAARDARDAVDQVRGGLRGTLRIGTMTYTGPLDLPGLLSRYHRDYPDVSLRLTVAPTGSQGLVSELAEGRADLAIVSLPGPPPPGLDLRELACDPLVLLVPAGHRLAGLPSADITELAGEAFVDYPLGYGNRAVSDRAFAAAGLTRHVVIETTTFPDAAAFVGHGLGITLLPRYAVPDRPDVRDLPVRGADLTWPVSVATPAGRTPSAAARALLQLLAPA